LDSTVLALIREIEKKKTHDQPNKKENLSQ